MKNWVTQKKTCGDEIFVKHCHFSINTAFNVYQRRTPFSSMFNFYITTMLWVNTFLVNVPNLCPLKTTENFWFLVFSGGIKWKHWEEKSWFKPLLVTQYKITLANTVDDVSCIPFVVIHANFFENTLRFRIIGGLE